MRHVVGKKVDILSLLLSCKEFPKLISLRQHNYEPYILHGFFTSDNIWPELYFNNIFGNTNGTSSV